jgi:hypothetical protein
MLAKFAGIFFIVGQVPWPASSAKQLIQAGFAENGIRLSPVVSKN